MTDQRDTDGHPCERRRFFRRRIKHDVWVRWEASDGDYAQISPIGASEWLLAICPPRTAMHKGGRTTIYCRRCDEVLAPIPAVEGGRND